MFRFNICQNISNTYFTIHILACLIGIASWVDMSGLWLQLPVFVTVLPEKWTLASFVVLIQQVANIGPIIFAICACVFARKKVEQPTSCIIIVIGIVACVLLSFFWDKTSVLGGVEHSTALFALSFMLAFVDTTSTLAFLSFMAMLKPEYLPSYFIGESLSTLLPALIAFGQGSGNVNCLNISSEVSKMENGTWNNFTIHYEVPIYEPPTFAVQYFFLILAGFLTVSLLAYILLMCFPRCNLFESAYSNREPHRSSKRSYNLEKSGFDNLALQVECAHSGNEFDVKTESPEKVLTDKEESKSRKPVSTGMLVFLMLQTCWKGILFTITMSIQPYFALPFGLKVYHLSNALGTAALPTGCLLCFLFPMYSVVGVTILTVLYSGLSSYFFYMASASPFPPLVDDEAGPPVLITLGFVLMVIWTYSEVAIAGILRPGGRRAMILFGVSIQIGSVIGGIVAYVMVNVYHVFKDAQPC